jgi:uncharacterized protein YgiM (DUF1202 family)
MNTMRRIKEQSNELIAYYEKYFRRTAQKFIRRTPLEESDYGREFVFEGEKYKFLGQSSEIFYVIQKENGDYYMVNHKVIEPEIVKARG